MNLPQITGSEKQIKWANDIRNEMIVLIDLYQECLYEFLECNLEKAKKTATRNNKEVSEVLLFKMKKIEEKNLKLVEYFKEELLHNQTKSTFFIDFRFSYISALEWCAAKKKDELQLVLERGNESRIFDCVRDKYEAIKK